MHPSNDSVPSSFGSSGMEREIMPPPISVTINTLLGGAFLLEVDPLTRVVQVKDMLSQMQGIPVRQQSLIYKQKVLPDEACLYQCGIRDGATMSLVLRVSSALTNVMVNEPTIETDSMMAECFGFDFESMDFLDVTGLDELEQDELLSMLFGPSDDGANRPQTFVLCRDGDKINVLQLGSGDPQDPSQMPPGAGGFDDHHLHHSARSPGAGSASHRSTGSPSALGRDGVPLQDRIRRFEENARHRKSMADLMARMRERKLNRRAKSKMFGSSTIPEDSPAASTAAAAAAAASEGGPAVMSPATPRSSYPPNATSSISPPMEFQTSTHRASTPPTVASRNGILPSIGRLPATDALRKHVHTESTPERRHLSSAGGGSAGRRRRSGAPTSAHQQLAPRNLDRTFALVDGERVASPSPAACRAHSALSYAGSARSARSGSRAPMPPRTQGDGFQSNPSAGSSRLHLPVLSPKATSGSGSNYSTPQKSALNANHTTVAAPCTPCPVATALTAPAAPSKTKKRIRCAHCNRKVKLATSFHCRCDKTFCGQHRYAETHSCTFDYKSAGRKMLENASPSIATPKLPKI